MKYFNYGLILFLGFTMSTIQAQDFTSAPDYNDYIVTQHSIVLNKNLEYLSYSVHSMDFMTIEKKRQEAVQQIESSSSNISKMPAFDSSTRLRDEAVAVLNAVLETYKVEMSQIITLKENSNDSFGAMEKYFRAQDKVEKKLERTQERLYRAQAQFAKKNGMELNEEDDSDRTDMLKKINELNEYTRQIFLVQFKVTKAESKFVESINEQNGPLAEMRRGTLLNATKEAKEKLDKMESFHGDDDYRKSALEVVNYRNEMAEKDMKRITSILKDKKRTNEDVEFFNKTMESYNLKINELIQQFNIDNSELMKKHVPKMIERKIRRT